MGVAVWTSNRPDVLETRPSCLLIARFRVQNGEHVRAATCSSATNSGEAAMMLQRRRR
jgi:hypothetical protein